MKISWEQLNINEDGHLVLGGCDAVWLAKKFGTPLYVVEEDKIRRSCRSFVEALRGYGRALYASKAFLNVAMCKIVEQEGLGLDVVSYGELHTALTAGFPVKKIYMHGNCKSDMELEMAVSNGIGRIVADSVPEIARIDAVAKRYGAVMDVLLRVKPGVEAHTHEYVITGAEDSKFGMSLATGEAEEGVAAALKAENVNLAGIHCHIGSQIFETAPFEKTVEKIAQFMKVIKDKYGAEFSEVNMGGGYGIHYTEKDKPLAAADYVRAIIAKLESECARLGLAMPEIVIEPGRSIIGEAVTMLYTVCAIKYIPGIRKYVSVDGGMADNPRPALYQSEYTAFLANRANDEPCETVTVAGRCCESGDILLRDAHLPKARLGDIVAVLSSGAYQYSMASNYNRLAIPAAVLVSGGRAEFMVRRQSLEDLVRNDCVPSWLEKQGR